MAEGAYESGSEYGFDVSSALGSAPGLLFLSRRRIITPMGTTTAGECCPLGSGTLDAPGAVQMEILRKAFEARPEWWQLVPDQTILVRGGKHRAEPC